MLGTLDAQSLVLGLGSMARRGAKAWVEYLDKVELPILSKTIKSIGAISESDDIKIEELVKVILQDADLTSKVLKLANSSCYLSLIHI